MTEEERRSYEDKIMSGLSYLINMDKDQIRKYRNRWRTKLRSRKKLRDLKKMYCFG